MNSILGFRPGIAWVCLFLLSLLPQGAWAAGETPGLAPVTGTTFRLYEGLTLLINNPEGREFTLELDIRDLNLVEPGPRELLLKVYDPEGKTLVREVVPDDGVTTPVSQSPTAGWDHECWYYMYHHNRGVAPMLNWSGLTAPDRLSAIPARTMRRQIPAGPGGAYRVVLIGARDHVASVRIAPELPWAVAGNPYFLHPTGDFLKKRFFFLPAGVKSINLALVEHDRPRTRQLTLCDSAGAVLWSGTAGSGAEFAEIKPPTPEAWNDQVFSLEVSDGPGAFMVQCALLLGKLEGPLGRPVQGGLQVFLAPDPETAKALGAGVIMSDDQRFFQPLQARLNEWLKKLTPADFEILNADGKPAKQITIKQTMKGYAASKGYDIQPNRNAEFKPMNGPHQQAPISDTLMFSYDLHRNRQALNTAIRDVIGGLCTLGPGDNPLSVTWRGMGNLAYLFGTYSWHWWRPAWRILRHEDTPADIRALLQEAFVNAGDRLAFCRNWERVNGNAYSTIVCGLRYAVEGTADPLLASLFDTYYQRFISGGWGPRVGLGPSGLVQEEFAYDHHYGAYPFATWGSVAEDLKDPRFISARDGFSRFFSYTLNDEVSANPFSSRTAHNPDPPMVLRREGEFAWKGLPGPDLTGSINDGNEFFAARRQGYYILSYHGRMTPLWQNEGFMGQIGWSGGTLCQFVVPGKGTVLAGTLNPPGYGKGMHTSEWRNFHINTIAGVMADGSPFVAAQSEHANARLEGNAVTGSGDVRNSSLHASRSYTYNPDHVAVEAKLRVSDDDRILSFWYKSPFRGFVCEAWEMIPFMPYRKAKVRDPKPEDMTAVRLLDAAGRDLGELTATPAAGQTVVVDRGGYGVRIELEQPFQVCRGNNNTVMIRLIEPTPPGPRDPAKKPQNAGDISLRYRLVPFGM